MNIKKLDEKDVVFVDGAWSDEEKKQFSAFLQKRKSKALAEQVIPNRKRRTGTIKKQHERYTLADTQQQPPLGSSGPSHARRSRP